MRIINWKLDTVHYSLWRATIVCGKRNGEEEKEKFRLPVGFELGSCPFAVRSAAVWACKVTWFDFILIIETLVNFFSNKLFWIVSNVIENFFCWCKNKCSRVSYFFFVFMTTKVKLGNAGARNFRLNGFLPYSKNSLKDRSSMEAKARHKWPSWLTNSRQYCKCMHRDEN